MGGLGVARGVVVLGVTVGAAAWSQACAGSHRGPRVSDGWISAEVESKLAADPQTNALAIDVDTRGGVVALRGVVHNETERREAADLAGTVRGVARVDNYLSLTDVHVQDRVSDAAITAEVKTKLVSDEEVDAGDIDVDTMDGRVTLSGFVETPDERERAEGLARTIAGVDEVDNQLRISPEP